jgi:hypothetical protein
MGASTDAEAPPRAAVAGQIDTVAGPELDNFTKPNRSLSPSSSILSKTNVNP